MVLSQFQALLAAARLGSLTAAARELGYSQSALSRQIAGLEREVGVDLLDRRTRGVVLTEAGQALLPHARIAVHEARQALEWARRTERHSVVTLGAVPSAAAALAPRALRLLGMNSEYRPMSVSMISLLTPQLLEMVRTHDLDAALVTDAPPGLPVLPEVEMRHVLDDPMVVLVPTDHPQVRRTDARKTAVKLEQFAGETWIEDNDSSEALLLKLATRAGIDLGRVSHMHREVRRSLVG